MKTFARALILIATVTVVAACGKKDEANNKGTVNATLAQPSARCLDTFGSSSWSPYYNYGFGEYAGYNNQSGFYAGGGFYGSFGGAPYPAPAHSPHYSHGRRYGGYGRPGYNSNFYPSTPYPAWTPQQGFCGCPNGTVPVCDSSAGMACVNTNHLNGVPYTTWNWDPIASRFNQGQYGGFSRYNDACYSNIGQTCQVGTASCGASAICVATMANSPIGICARY